LQELDDLLKILEDPGKNCGGNWKILARILKILKDLGKNIEYLDKNFEDLDNNFEDP